MAKRQSVGTTAVVRELANSLDKGIAKKSASQRILCGRMSSGPAPFEILRLESALCSTGITTVEKGRVGVGFASSSRKLDE